MSNFKLSNSYNGDGQTLISPKDINFKHFNRKLKLACMASGAGTNFESLVHNINSQNINADISILIVNKEHCEARTKARKLGVRCEFIDHNQFREREDFDRKIVTVLKNEEVDGIVMAGWMRIVTSVLIEAYPQRIINIHPSLLPSFKGSNSIRQALESKVLITGCSVHYVSAEVDSGPIIIQAAVPIIENDTITTLRKRIQEQEYKILPMALNIIGNEWSKINTYG